ncbi:PREDICTED: 50S ribosomal protein 6, chloroplastic [Tarenaya hassleriana]|uniref:50S ribosomal protein 6, chloroplastic n=1 Tax=Tarenaya hassleriana TaxID=28532 RepID=UPI00053C55E1|nr:PREDICTED: 50S ribosomal protein 6, chloroplastic [Tarenaya hassleriana]
MSVSAIFGTGITAVAPPLAIGFRRKSMGSGGGATAIECSSRPQKKATKHHMKSRPKKTQPWDVKRKPTVYSPLPPLPPDYTLLSGESSAAEAAARESPLSSAAS